MLGGGGGGGRKKKGRELRGWYRDRCAKKHSGVEEKEGQKSEGEAMMCGGNGGCDDRGNEGQDGESTGGDTGNGGGGGMGG